MQEKKLSEQESLALIAQMINTAKDSFVDTGIGPILWGSVIAICSLVQVAQIHYRFQLPFDIWLLTIAAIVPQILISIKERKLQRHRGWADQAIGYVWMCFGIGIFLTNFISVMYVKQVEPIIGEYEKLSGHATGNVHFWSYATSFLMLLYGIPTIVTAAVRKFPVMMAGGIFCWLCCVFCVFTTIKIDFLLMGVCAIFAWLVPGIIIRIKYLKQGKPTNV